MADLRNGARSDPLRVAPAVRQTGHNPNHPERDTFSVEMATRTRKFYLVMNREEALQLYADLETKMQMRTSGALPNFPG